jgi:adenylate kinase family enzyme
VNKDLQDMHTLGRRIAIVGISASGKTTYARKLAKKLQLPAIFMDAIMWNPGWEYIGYEATALKLEEISEGSNWIIEGYITEDAHSFILHKADTIIYLDYSPLTSCWRYIKRCWKHRINPRPELQGCPDKFSFKFLMLIWNKSESISLEKYLLEVTNQSKIIRLHTQKEADTLLRNI